MEAREAGENSEGAEGLKHSEGRDEGEDREAGEGLVEEARETRRCREGAHTERLAFHQLPAWLQVMESGAEGRTLKGIAVQGGGLGEE